MFLKDDYARVTLDNILGLGLEENKNQDGDYALSIKAAGASDTIFIPIESYSGDMVRTILESSNDESGLAAAIGIPTFDDVFGMRRLKDGTLMLFDRNYFFGDHNGTEDN